MSAPTVPADVARTRSRVGVVALLVLAGCAGSGLPAGELTVTPVPVPTDPTATPTVQLAPGVSRAGVDEPGALTSAHAEALRNATFRVHIVERVEPGDGGPAEYRVVSGTVANRSSYRLRVARRTGNETQYMRQLYADTDALYGRVVVDTGPRYYVPRERLSEGRSYPVVSFGRLDQRKELYMALVATDPAYVGTVTVNGTAFHRIVATEASAPAILAGWNNANAVTDVEFEALVAPDGRVHEFQLSYVETVGDERRRVERTARWTALGNTTVPAPAWYESVRNQTGG